MPVFKPIRQMIDLAENPPSDETVSWLWSKPDPIRRPQLADVYGPFAVFRIKYGYNITHVPTGLRVLNVIGNKALAIQVLDRLLEHETEWTDGGPFTFGTLPDHWSGRTLHELTCRACEVMFGPCKSCRRKGGADD